MGRVPPLGSADVNVRYGMPTAESRRSPFGQSLPLCAIQDVLDEVPTFRYRTFISCNG